MKFSMLWITGLLLTLSAMAYEDQGERTKTEKKRYTYSWLYADDDAMRPRGGTTQGPKVNLATGFSESWEALQAEDLTARERDRRAILAMAGPYRTSFDFIETLGFVEDYSPASPYQSWGTEYVYVVADEPEFISLQHILVMIFKNDDGSLSDPMVVKHWRHDWTYQDRDLMAYAGHNSWKRRQLSEYEAEGAWTQAVFQVDDSPRYETYGRWVHQPGYSHWESELTVRPLPRREFSVRSDYHALAGVMRISITPNGWVMEEDALKMVLNEDGSTRTPTPYLAREAGISRYERIDGFDFSAGDRYWADTGAFWAEVRDYWRDLYRDEKDFALHKSVEGKPLYATMFALARDHAGAEADGKAIRKDLDRALAPYIR